MIQLIHDTNKVGQVQITTNGTILPSDKVLQSIRGKNVKISISNYGELSTRKNELIKKLQEYKIPFEIGEEHKIWVDFGELKVYERTEEEYKTQFTNCKSTCRSYYKGKLHFCPRSSHGMDLGLVPDNLGDYIDLNREDMTTKLFAELYEKLETKDYIEACRYCKKGAGKLEEFPAAEQMPRI